MCCFELCIIDVVMYRNVRFGWYFSCLAAVLSCCRYRKFWVRAYQHGPCWFTRAPVLIYWMGKENVFPDTFQHGPCWFTRAPVLIPCIGKITCFWTHFHTGSVDLHGHPCWTSCVGFWILFSVHAVMYGIDPVLMCSVWYVLNMLFIDFLVLIDACIE